MSFLRRAGQSVLCHPDAPNLRHAHTGPRGLEHKLTRSKRLAFSLIIVSTIVIVPEVVIRLVRLPPGFFPVDPKEDPLYVADPIRGYTLNPGAHSDYITPDIDVDIDINPDGVRDAPLTEARKAQYRVLAVGDSFTMGLGVAQQDAWSEQLERLMQLSEPSLGVAVVNGGVPGYRPRQIRERLEELLPRVQPNLVVFGLVTETFVRMFRPLQLFGGTLVRSDAIPRMRLTRNAILYSPFEHGWMRELDFWLNQHWQFGAHMLARLHRAANDEEVSDWKRIGLDPEVVRHQMEPTFAELTRSRDVAADAGATFLVLLINLQDQGDSFGPRQAVYNGVVLGYCKTKGIRCVDPCTARCAGGRGAYDGHSVNQRSWSGSTGFWRSRSRSA